MIFVFFRFFGFSAEMAPEIKFVFSLPPLNQILHTAVSSEQGGGVELHALHENGLRIVARHVFNEIALSVKTND